MLLLLYFITIILRLYYVLIHSHSSSSSFLPTSILSTALHYISDGWTALHFAALNGHENVVKLLLQKNINVNVEAMTEDGRTPRSMAEVAGHTNIVKLIDEYIAQQQVKTDL